MEDMEQELTQKEAVMITEHMTYLFFMKKIQFLKRPPSF